MILFLADISKLHEVTNIFFSHTIKRVAAYTIEEDDLLLKRQNTMKSADTAIFVNVCVSICILFQHLQSTEARTYLKFYYKYKLVFNESNNKNRTNVVFFPVFNHMISIRRVQ